LDANSRKVNFIIDFIYYCIIFLLLFFGVKYLLSPLLPFITAFIIVAASRKIVTYLSGGKVSQKSAYIIFTLTLIVLLSFIIFGVSYGIYSEISSLSSLISAEGIESISEKAGEIIDRVFARIPKIPFINGIISSIKNSFTKLDETLVRIAGDFMPDVLSGTVKFLSFFPQAVIFLTLMFIAVFYIGCDYGAICAFLLLQLPLRFSEQFYEAKDTFIATAKELFKAYFVLTAITFFQLLTGFLVMRIDYSLILALIISIVDLIPILGTGTVLVPWAIISAFSGNLPRTAGLIILYVVIALFRRIAEPKIVGANIGLTPLLSLITMYIGLKLFGIWGLIVFPILTITVISLNEKGLIRLYRNVPENSEQIIQKTKKKFLNFKRHDNKH